MTGRILFADDTETLVSYIQEKSKKLGYNNIDFITSIKNVKEYICSNDISRIIIDLAFEGETDSGLDILEHAKSINPSVECILITGKNYDHNIINRLKKIDGILITKNKMDWKLMEHLLSDEPLPKSNDLIKTNNPDIGEVMLRLDEKNIKNQKHDNKPIYILHLSDIHIDAFSEGTIYFNKLSTDLKKELNINKLDYVVITGDIGNYSIKNEYSAALIILSKLKKKFKISNDKIIIVPGNHDINWDISREAYKFKYHKDMEDATPESYMIDAGNEGKLVRDETSYSNKITIFCENYYNILRKKQPYPLEVSKQGIIYKFTKHKIIYLGLNSAWEIDHHFTERSSINPEALANALDSLNNDKYNDWLKIAIFHHPVTGNNSMNNDFLEMLAVHNFKICMHGHIHEAKEGFYKYDNDRCIHIIGAGTFGAPADQQITSIPLQYNLLKLDPNSKVITVETRKKEKPDGSWSADARWGKKNPKARYYIEL